MTDSTLGYLAYLGMDERKKLGGGEWLPGPALGIAMAASGAGRLVVQGGDYYLEGPLCLEGRHGFQIRVSFPRSFRQVISC